MKLSERQAELYDLAAHDYKIVIADGPVRSGKTLAGLWGLLTYAQQRFHGQQLVVAVQAEDVWNGTVRAEASKWAATVNARLVFKKRQFTVSTVSGGRRRVNTYLRYIARDVSAVGRLQGLTLAGAFVTEAALMPQDFITELTFRTLTMGDAKIVLDCNPENAHHWLKTEYIDRAEERGAKHVPFKMRDNPVITPEAWEKIVAETPPGHVARRKLYGEWCNAAGLVWDVETPRAVGRPPSETPRRIDVAIDSASSSVTHALLVAQYSDSYWVVDEWRHDASGSTALAPMEQIDRIREAFKPWGEPRNWVSDCADGHFNVALRQLRRDGKIRGQVLKSDKRVKTGIDAVAWMLNRRRLRINRKCSGLLADIASYAWDPKAAEKGEDKPVKRDDHGCDALRYWAMMNLHPGRPKIKRRGNAV